MPLFSCLWICCLSLSSSSVSPGASEQQLLVARNFILKGKKDVVYVTANTVAKLQPRIFLEHTWLETAWDVSFFIVLLV